MYEITYWLKGQSRLFSAPQKTTVLEEILILALQTARDNGYEIESVIRVKEA